MDKKYLQNIASIFMLGLLMVLSFFLMKPIFMAIITGVILAFVFVPLYNKINNKLKAPNFSVAIVCLVLFALIIIPLWFLVPVLLKQSVQIYTASQKIDFVTPLKALMPSLFEIEAFSAEIGSTIYSFVTNITNGIMNSVSDLIKNMPTLFLQLLVTLFTFYFAVRDNDKFVNYIQSLLPFPKEIEKKLFKSSRDITFSVLYGQVVIGIIQGLIAGGSFYLFGVDNALFLLLVACVAGVFPIVGTSVVWIPVAIWMATTGEIFAAVGISFFGIFGWISENVFKPMFISKRTNVHSAIILLGMVGGLFLWGILGVILGPLILAYLLIVLEIYRDKRVPGIFIQHPEDDDDEKMGFF